MKMKLWVDDVRPAPDGYFWCNSVNEAKRAIEDSENNPWYERWENGVCVERWQGFELIDIDHDAGDFAPEGGDYIKLLDWLEETGRNYPIRIHSQNVVGRMNMRAIIQRNGWTEVL